MRRVFFSIICMILLISCADFIETDISKKKIEVIAPSDKISLSPGLVSFHWELMDGAESYRFIIVTPSFANAEAVVSDVRIFPDSLAHNVSYEQILQAGEYQWRVSGMNAISTSATETYNLSAVDVPEDGDENEEEE